MNRTLLILLFLIALPAQAADRVYVCPLVLDASGTRVPKYIHSASLDYSLIDAGKRNLCIVVADVDEAQHTTLSNQTDVVSVPANLDNTFTAGAVTSFKARLDQLNLPIAWVDTNTTYRQALRVLAGIFLLAQRFHGMTGLDLFTQLDNDIQIKNAPLATRQKIGLAMDSLAEMTGVPWDSSNVDPNWTFKELLQNSGLPWKQIVIRAGRMAW